MITSRLIKWTLFKNFKFIAILGVVLYLIIDPLQDLLSSAFKSGQDTGNKQ